MIHIQVRSQMAICREWKQRKWSIERSLLIQDSQFVVEKQFSDRALEAIPLAWNVGVHVLSKCTHCIPLSCRLRQGPC
jgi:hypothetical protein